MKHTHRLMAILVLIGGLLASATTAGAVSPAPGPQVSPYNGTGVLTAEASLQLVASATWAVGSSAAPSSSGPVAKAIGQAMLQSLQASEVALYSTSDEEVTDSDVLDTPDDQEEDVADESTPEVDIDIDEQDVEDEDVDEQDVEDQVVDEEDVEEQDVDDQDVEDQDVDEQEVDDEDQQDEEVIATPTVTPTHDENISEDNQNEDVNDREAED